MTVIFSDDPSQTIINQNDEEIKADYNISKIYNSLRLMSQEKNLKEIF
jgi:hypothetical protein